MRSVIEINNIEKKYTIGDNIINALRGVYLNIESGDMISIMGSSGSGKSTLLNIIGCLDKANTGEYLLDGISVMSLSKNQTADIRNKKIGFVFQSFNLLQRSSAIENVELPLIYYREKKNQENTDLAYEALKKVGLEDRIYHEAQQLSGGQQQRVAIARAIVNKPSILLADEPTGNLDSETSKDIMSLFKKLNEELITVILVTHDPIIAKYTNKIMYMKDGVFI
jgi:putative ABC transport system ATP-binding protein